MSDSIPNPFEFTKKWYEVFDQSEFIASRPGLDLENISEERLHLKMKLIAEEFGELIGAVYGKAAEEYLKSHWDTIVALDDGTRDIVEAADAIGDLAVVESGFALETGMPYHAITQEVFNSNMSKLGRDGKPVISDGVTPSEYDGQVKPAGKLLKGPDFVEPDFKRVLGL